MNKDSLSRGERPMVLGGADMILICGITSIVIALCPPWAELLYGILMMLGGFALASLGGRA